jgi:endonuclease/exonuclease/phosphatase family metal-dependent hydrolase
VRARMVALSATDAIRDMQADIQTIISRCALLALLVVACVAGVARADGNQSRDPAVLRVGSQNLLHDFPKFHKVHGRYSRIAAEIRRLDLDVVGLQESAWITRIGLVPEKIAQLLGYHFVHFELETTASLLGFKNGIAIISRYPIVAQERLVFRHQNNIFEARAVIRTVIQTPLSAVNFYSTHLSGDSGELNLKQSQELVAFIERHRADGPAILAGDFNFHGHAASRDYLAKVGYVDTFRAANPGRDNATCCTCIERGYSNWFDTCPTESFLRADDRVYLIPGLVIRGEVVDSDFIMGSPFMIEGRWVWASDHKGIKSVIRLASHSDTRDTSSRDSDR